jgi:DNA-directed RNA polymerase subunit RPC12/RpoP
MRLLRPTGEDRPVINLLEEEDLYITSPELVKGFPGGSPEQCVVTTYLVQAMLLTPTCNLKDEEGDWSPFWLFAPVQAWDEATGFDKKTLFSTSVGYKALFGLPADPLGAFPDAYVDFQNVVSAPSSEFQDRSSRIKTLSRTAFNHLAYKTANFIGTTWGYSVQEPVEKTGPYRCLRCTRFVGIEIHEETFQKGQLPIHCKNCGERAVWIPLEPFKKKK